MHGRICCRLTPSLLPQRGLTPPIPFSRVHKLPRGCSTNRPGHEPSTSQRSAGQQQTAQSGTGRYRASRCIYRTASRPVAMRPSWTTVDQQHHCTTTTNGLDAAASGPPDRLSPCVDVVCPLCSDLSCSAVVLLIFSSFSFSHTISGHHRTPPSLSSSSTTSSPPHLDWISRRS